MKAYQLKIALKNSKPPIWRRCIIPSGITFSQLSLLLNEIMGWSGGHLSEFDFYHRKLWIMENDELGYFAAPWDYDLLDSAQTFIDEFMESEDWFTYIYDLGDDWAHRVTIEKVIENYEENFARVIKYKGDCPPEDIGGIDMYQTILDGTYQEITGFPVDEIYLEEYDIDEVNDCLQSMYFVHWEKIGENRLAHTIFEEDIVNGKGLLGCQNPINDYSFMKFSNDNFIVNIDSENISQYEEANKALKEMAELMREINKLYKVNGKICQGQVDDWLESLTPKRKLAVCLTSFTKDDLIDIGMEHGIDIKKSWKKDKMLQLVCEAILNRETFKRNISRLGEKEINAFERAISSTNAYIMNPEEFILFDKLYTWGYALITIDNEVIVPLDVASLYNDINTKEFKENRKYMNWINKCIFYQQYYYGCVPVNTMLKLVNMKTTINIDGSQLKTFLNEFTDKVSWIGQYIIVNELVETGSYEDFMQWQGKDKGYYIPTVDEIDYFYDNKFYKPSKYDLAMIKYIEKICENHDEAVMTEQIIQRMIYNEERLQDILDELENVGVFFRDEKDIGEFIMLFNDLWNNTRLLANKGHTPDEIVRSIPFSPNNCPTIVPVSSEAAKLLTEGKEQLEQKGFKIDLESTAHSMNVIDISNSGEIFQTREKKVYPNDPCPCGSGKKYKKCCGKNN